MSEEGVGQRGRTSPSLSRKRFYISIFADWGLLKLPVFGFFLLGIWAVKGSGEWGVGSREGNGQSALGSGQS